MEPFSGFTDEMSRFFLDIRFNNSKAYFLDNKARYEEYVKKPLHQLVEALAPHILEVDPDLVVRPSRVVSRIYRDTRYSKDKSPMRDHLWLAFKKPGERVSGSFCPYFEVWFDHFQYGMGFYDIDRDHMDALRERMLRKKREFTAAVQKAETIFSVVGDDYKRPLKTDLPKALVPYYNKKGFSFNAAGPFEMTKSVDLVELLAEGYRALTPIYNFINHG